MQSIDCVRDDGYRRVKPEGKVSPANIVIDGLRDPDDPQAMLLPQIARRRKRSFATNNNQRVQTKSLPIVFDRVNRLVVLQRIKARRAQNCSTAWKYSGNCVSS